MRRAEGLAALGREPELLVDRSGASPPRMARSDAYDRRLGRSSVVPNTDNTMQRASGPRRPGLATCKAGTRPPKRRPAMSECDRHRGDWHSGGRGASSSVWSRHLSGAGQPRRGERAQALADLGERAQVAAGMRDHSQEGPSLRSRNMRSKLPAWEDSHLSGAPKSWRRTPKEDQAQSSWRVASQRRQREPPPSRACTALRR